MWEKVYTDEKANHVMRSITVFIRVSIQFLLHIYLENFCPFDYNLWKKVNPILFTYFELLVYLKYLYTDVVLFIVLLTKYLFLLQFCFKYLFLAKLSSKYYASPMSFVYLRVCYSNISVEVNLSMSTVSYIMKICHLNT